MTVKIHTTGTTTFRYLQPGYTVTRTPWPITIRRIPPMTPAATIDAVSAAAVQPRYPAMDPTLPSTISVYGVGSTQAEPDQAVITFAVADTSPSVELARNETARLAEAIASAAREAGIAPSDVATTNFSIYADYDWNNNVRYLRGYTVTHSMAITIRRIDDAGATIDAVSAAAGDSLEFHSISFGHQNSTALASAVTELAAASHRLGPLLSLTEGQPPPISTPAPRAFRPARTTPPASRPASPTSPSPCTPPLPWNSPDSRFSRAPSPGPEKPFLALRAVCYCKYTQILALPVGVAQ